MAQIEAGEAGLEVPAGYTQDTTALVVNVEGLGNIAFTAEPDARIYEGNAYVWDEDAYIDGSTNNALTPSFNPEDPYP